MQKTIMVISDSTGDTAEKAVRAALHQFEAKGCRIRVYSNVRLDNEMEHIVERARELHAVLGG